MKKYYTGIGSRDTPKDILDQMFDTAVKLAKCKWILRSGGADGADTAFELGTNKVENSIKEIYLPWKEFNNNTSHLHEVSMAALELASTIHPCWSALTQGGTKLHGRNCYQVLGKDLQTPSEFVICWTKDGKDIGGTRTAIVLARKNNIPVINMYNKGWQDELRRFYNVDASGGQD